MDNLADRHQSPHNRIKVGLQGSIWFYGPALGAILYRLLHLFGPIDEPQTFRQSETAGIAWDFYRHGIHLLAPSVCWLGDHKTLILEFPLPEAIIAIAYHLLGPYLWVARLVTLSFFIGSAIFLLRIIKYLHGVFLARLATVLYLIFPLSLFYSRAIHIDFVVMFFALAMMDGLLRAINEQRLAPALWGTLAGVFAFLIKAPYAFFLLLPLTGFIIARSRYQFALRYGIFMALPLIGFLLWRYHAETVNSRAPDLFFLPDYFSFTNMGWWYYGTLAQRLNLDHWFIIAERFVKECCTVIGFPIFLVGLFWRPPSGHGATFFQLWFIGTLIFVIVFFNLNIQHNYYQIPFLPVIAFFIANGVQHLARVLAGAKRIRSANIYVYGITSCIIFNALWTSERRYYWIDTPRNEAARLIELNTPESALIMTVRPDITAVDPILLSQAHRYGWSVNIKALNSQTIERLRKENAAYLAVVTDKPLDPEIGRYLSQFTSKHFQLKDHPWCLHLYLIRP